MVQKYGIYWNLLVIFERFSAGVISVFSNEDFIAHGIQNLTDHQRNQFSFERWNPPTQQ